MDISDKSSLSHNNIELQSANSELLQPRLGLKSYQSLPPPLINNNIKQHPPLSRHLSLNQQKSSQQHILSIQHQQLSSNLQQRFVFNFNSLLQSKFNPLIKSLLSIQNKIDSIEPLIQIKVIDTRGLSSQHLLIPFQKSITSTIQKSLSDIQRSINMSVNNYNKQLSARQKKFNIQREQVARVAIQNNLNSIKIKKNKSQQEYKRLQERRKMLLRSDNNCEQIIDSMEQQIQQIEQNIIKIINMEENQGQCRTVEIDGEYYELMQVTEDQLMQKLLKEYDIDFEIPNPTQLYNRGGNMNYTNTQRRLKY